MPVIPAMQEDAVGRWKCQGQPEQLTETASQIFLKMGAWACRLVTEYLPSMCKVLNLIPILHKENNKTKTKA